MLDRPATSPDELRQAADIGQEAGLHYVYAGNLPGRVGSLENTYCPSCGELLVERRGYRIWKMNLGAEGVCPGCLRKIAGVWQAEPVK
jgi:pyruvate formate lyase activating enzyme